MSSNTTIYQAIQYELNKPRNEARLIQIRELLADGVKQFPKNKILRDRFNGAKEYFESRKFLEEKSALKGVAFMLHNLTKPKEQNTQAREESPHETQMKVFAKARKELKAFSLLIIPEKEFEEALEKMSFEECDKLFRDINQLQIGLEVERSDRWPKLDNPTSNSKPQKYGKIPNNHYLQTVSGEVLDYLFHWSRRARNILNTAIVVKREEERLSQINEVAST